ncbi:MAG: 3'-5' exonuclease [Steroidobacteraceae bacterium]
MLTDSIVVFDIETSGLNPEDDRITQVSALKLADGEIAERYTSLARSNVRVPASVSQVSGISNEMLSHAPPIQDVIRQLRRFIGWTPVAIYNEGFSWLFYRAELARLQLHAPQAQPLCLYRLAKRLLPQLPHHSQVELAHHFGLSVERGPGSPINIELTVDLLHALADTAARRSGAPMDVRALLGIANE